MRRKVFIVSALILVIAIGAIYMLLPKNIEILRSGITSKVNATGSGTQEDPWDISYDDETSNVTAVLSEDGTLTISGTGMMMDCNPSWYWRGNINTVIIEEGVTNIGNYIFANSGFLENISIPETVTSIGVGAFYKCEYLTDIIIPNTIEKIGNSAFKGCENLTEITIPENVSEIGDWVFDDCFSLAVVNVAEGNANYKSIDGVLFSLDNTGNLKNLKYYPSQKQAQSYSIPEGVIMIESRAFANCNNLLSLNIPSSVEYIYSNQFVGCSNLENINVNEVSNDYKSIEGGLFSIKQNELEGLVYYPVKKVNTSYTIPDGVKWIDSCAFRNNNNINEIIIPESVNMIGSNAFEDCSNLLKINIPNGLTRINAYLFRNCSSLQELIIPEGVKTISYYAFQNCTSLQSIKIPSSVKDSAIDLGVEPGIYYGAFEGCINLKEIVFPENVATIKEDTFKGCTNLQKVVVPNSVTTIEGGAFGGCISLKEITLPTGTVNEEINVVDGCNIMRAFVDSVLNIPVELDEGESQLEVDLPDILKRAITEDDVLYAGLENITFENCELITNESKIKINSQGIREKKAKVNINTGALSGFSINFKFSNLKWNISADSSSNVVAYLSEDGTTLTISGSGNMKDFSSFDRSPWYENKDKITSATIEEGIINIGNYCFYPCKNIETIMIPNSITSIGEGAFSYCESLKAINIPDGVKSIEETTFYNCYSLTNIELPSSVKSIGLAAFYSCKNLENINIPEGVTSIEAQTFYDCALKGITIPNSVTNIGSKAFISCDLKYIEIPDSVTSIGEAAFKNCVSLDNISIPEGVTVINEETFYNCHSLTSVEISNSVTSIGSLAFSDCWNLQEVNIPVGIQTIESCTFYNCYNLTEIVIPESITSIEGQAFCGCRSLKNLEIPNSVTTIGDRAFFNCESLEYIDIPDSVISVGEQILSYSILYLPVAFTNIEKENGETEREIELPSFITRSMIEGDILNSENQFFNFTNCSLNEENSKLKIKYKDLETAIMDIKSENINDPLHEFTIKFSEAVALDNLQIKQQAATTDYKVGENFDKTGLIIEATYENGDTKTIEDYTILNGENLQYGQESVTISYYEAGITKTVEQAITVSKAQGSISNIQDLSKIYDGVSVAEPTYDKVGDGEVTIEWYNPSSPDSLKLETAPTNAGIYVVKVILQEGENYQGASESKMFAIAKSTYDMSGISFTDATYVYDGTEKKVEITGELPEGVSVRYENNTGINSGEYSATAMFTGDIVNYNEIPNMTATLTISAMQGSINNITDISKTYDGDQVSNPNFDRVGDGEVSFEWYRVEGETETKLEEAPTNAGNYKVKVIMSSTTNYSGAELDKEFTIEKAQGNISSISDISKTYDGVAVENPTCEGIGDGQATVEWYSIEGNNQIKLDTAPINAGNYIVKVILAEGTNYKGTEAERTFTIEKATPTYNIPEELTVIEGRKLSSINLPEGFSWESDLETRLLQIGENRFTVTYTPEDTENYNVVTGIEVVVTVIAKPEIDLGEYEETEDEQTGRTYIENIDQNTTVEQIKEELGSNGEIEIYKGEEKVEDASKIATGMEVRITLDNNETISYETVVRGDITGDGQINDADLLILARYMVGFEKEKDIVTGAKLRATDVVKDNIFATDGDLLKLAKTLVGLDNL